MKILIALSLCFFSVFSIAASSKTDLDTNWSCTTNASSASTDADKAADNRMANEKAPVKKAFSLAAENCRDCTKITCEASQ
jgi:hypothetical protein